MTSAEDRLKAVLELHKPMQSIYDPVECWTCFDYNLDPVTWPCPTALAALGEDEAYKIRYRSEVPEKPLGRHEYVTFLGGVGVCDCEDGNHFGNGV